MLIAGQTKRTLARQQRDQQGFARLLPPGPGEPTLAVVVRILSKPSGSAKANRAGSL